MKFITTIFKKLFPQELPKPVGRWGLEQCNVRTNSKIDLSNEDHCGPCGQYALTKLELKEGLNVNPDTDKVDRESFVREGLPNRIKVM